MVRNAFCLALACSLLALPGRARELSEADFLADLPPVLTASRLAQPLMDAPNSITVIDRALIEASGYHNLSDLFRLVPGMYVGQEKGWFRNVSRTFADSYARRLQVLVDGRSVYLPSFGGVRWDALPMALDDIDRIEVVRGPNAASFGANAFTGTINIITRHPDDVRGRMLHLVGGDHAHQETWFRWAGSGEAGSHRVTLGRRQDGGFINQFDDERSNVLNYRGDFALAHAGALSVHLGYLQGERGLGDPSKLTDKAHDQKVDSYSLLVDYRLALSPHQELLAKASFDRLLTREVIPAFAPPFIPAGGYSLLDLLSQRWHAEVQLNSTHSAGLRSSVGGFLRRDEVQSAYYLNRPDKLAAASWAVFGHLEWRLAESWLLNAGAFFEDYETVGSRLSPRLTLHWQPGPGHAFRWGISRAYRNPVLIESNANIRRIFYAANGVSLGLPPTQPFIVASGNVDPERLTSQEIGYLGHWPEWKLNLDLRLFREAVSDLIGTQCTGVVVATCKGVFPVNPYDFRNLGVSTQRGLEGQAKWQAGPDTRVMANFAFLDIDSAIDEKRYSPSQQYGLHVMHAFPGKVELTLSHYWVPAFKPSGQGNLKDHKRLDARLAKRFKLDGLPGQVALTWESLTGSYIDFANDLIPGTSTPFNLFDSRAYAHFQLDF